MISGQGTQFTWGTTTFLLTSVSVQIGGQGEIDITSMSSTTVQDPENTGKWLISRDVDAAFAGEGRHRVVGRVPGGNLGRKRPDDGGPQERLENVVSF